jgi:predicted amidohydrolase
MKIALAQIRPVRGDIKSNISKHVHLINQAAKHDADIIVFPELSVTGYEPSQAKLLATDEDDSRFAIFQQLSDENLLIIGVGVPTKSDDGIKISMVLFQPRQPRRVNSKMYLHPDEDPFFVPGNNLPGLIINNTHIALAICYEISVPQHAEIARSNGAQLYIASVAKTTKGVEKAIVRLKEIAANYGMTVLMSNSIGLCEDGECGGRSSVWNNKGNLIGHLNDMDEGLLLFDTTTQESTALQS